MQVMSHLEGRGDRTDPGDGGRSRPRQHPGQLHPPGYARYVIGQVLVVDGGVTLQGPERDSRDH